MGKFVIDGVTAYRNDQQKLEKAFIPVYIDADTGAYVPMAGESGAVNVRIAESVNLELGASVEAVSHKGTATGGTNTTLVDSVLDILATFWVDKLIRIYHGTKKYIRKITASVGSTLTFAGLNTPVTEAAAVCEVDKAGGGKTTITHLNAGAPGNATTVVLTDGTVDGVLTGVLADDVLTVTSAYATGAAVTITAAALTALIETDPILTEIFSAVETTPGNLDTGATVYAFTGGLDEVVAIEVASGDKYEVLM
jgi:hypothetical protein